MKPKKYWLRIALVFVVTNTVLSIIAYNIPGIRHPHSFSDFQQFLFPNIALGIPAIAVGLPISYVLQKQFCPEPDYTNLRKGFTKEEFELREQESKFHMDCRYRIQLGTYFFIALNIYWFVIGSVIGALYGRRVNRQNQKI